MLYSVIITHTTVLMANVQIYHGKLIASNEVWNDVPQTIQ